MALPSTPPPPTDRAYENALEQADGPFASLRAYCAWYTRDCVRGDARLCICKVHPGPFADIATVETRDTGRGSDAVSHVAAFRTPAGWRVSRRGVEAHDGAETSQGASRASVRFDHHEMRDVLGDATPERLFWFTQAKEHSPPGVGGWSVYSRTDAFIACVDASPPRCTEPLDARTIYPAYPRDAGVSGMPTLRKDAHGRLVIDDPTSGEPPMVYEFREKDEAAD